MHELLHKIRDNLHVLLIFSPKSLNILASKGDCEINYKKYGPNFKQPQQYCVNGEDFKKLVP